MAGPLDFERLRRENREFRDTGGTSDSNGSHGFSPAFLDRSTGRTYVSCDSRGAPASFHRLDGLPEELVTRRGADGEVLAVRASVVSGFLRNGRFFSRAEAARFVAVNVHVTGGQGSFGRDCEGPVPEPT